MDTESEIYFIKERIEKLERLVAQNFEQPCMPSNRCTKCKVPLESYQAYACEDRQCPRPRTLA